MKSSKKEQGSKSTKMGSSLRASSKRVFYNEALSSTPTARWSVEYSSGKARCRTGSRKMRIF
jgi:hypothetical protein